MGVKAKNYKFYAALHEDIDQGFVWLKHNGPPRSVVKITYSGNRPVFCEALTLEANFLRRYNDRPEHQNPPYRIEAADLGTAIVVNHWYRSRLVRPRLWRATMEPLQTQVEYQLELALGHWYNKWWWRVRACLGHPQVVVRVAAWLALVSLALGLAGISGVTVFRSADACDLARYVVMLLRPQKQNASASVALSVGDVLAWRGKYGDLLGKPRAAVIERFGAPAREEASMLEWDTGSKTGNRALGVLFDSDSRESKVQVIKVLPRDSERLDVTDIVRRASMFTFDTGTYRDSLRNYFTASTKDERNVFQFEVSESGVKFGAVIFQAK